MSLSSDGLTLAVGGLGDNNNVVATWIFLYDGSMYRQVGNRLMGNDASQSVPQQGKGTVYLFIGGHGVNNDGSMTPGAAVSLSSNGSILAMADNNIEVATWIFVHNGSAYQQVGNKIVGNGTAPGFVSLKGKDVREIYEESC